MFENLWPNGSKHKHVCDVVRCAEQSYNKIMIINNNHDNHIDGDGDGDGFGVAALAVVKGNETVF